MSAHEQSSDRQPQDEQQQVTDLPAPHPSAEEADGVTGGMLVIGKAPPGYTGKVVPVMETSSGGTTPLT